MPHVPGSPVFPPFFSSLLRRPGGQGEGDEENATEGRDEGVTQAREPRPSSAAEWNRPQNRSRVRDRRYGRVGRWELD